MPEFVVVFEGPAVDQPEHPKVNRPVVDGLRVNAPSAQGALMHAIRVTRGQGEPVAVYNPEGKLIWGAGPEEISIPPTHTPLVEDPQDGPPLVFTSGAVADESLFTTQRGTTPS